MRRERQFGEREFDETDAHLKPYEHGHLSSIRRDIGPDIPPIPPTLV